MKVDAPTRPSPISLLPLLVGGLIVLSAPRVAGSQQPTQAQVQQALQQPGIADQLRQRIQSSGLTPDQIRARLSASGYSPTLLDAYLGGAASGGVQTAPGALELQAISALGLPLFETPLLPVDTGLMRSRSGYTPSRVFGVDVFRRTTTQFLPLLSGPVPADYKLGPGDNLVLILTGDVELAHTLSVTREGFILIPQVGQVFVSNLTLEQLRNVLYDRLGRVYSGVRRSNPTTRFDISVANVRANQIYVVGEVSQPGAYQISSLGTVLTALYAAGGVTDRANLRTVEVRRGDKPVATLDLYDYLLRGDVHDDVRLQTGDVVFVPVHGIRAEISGAVTRPAIYELRVGETLADLLGAAGGFRPNAQFKRITVHRLLPAAERGPGSPARAAIDVALLPGRREMGDVRPREGSSGVTIPPLSLLDGDSIVVDSVAALGGQYYVAIAGMVKKPGVYPWRQGMTLRDLVLLARGPVVGADLREAEIARMPVDRSQGQLATTLRVPLDSTYLFERDSAGRYVGPPGLAFPASGAAEVVLEPYDNALILRQPDFDFQRTVAISGEVRFPGTYSLRTKSDRLSSLFARGGGLTPQAYPEGIRFYRSVNGVGRINVDVRRALADTGSRFNIVLQPGDSMHIPEYTPSVKVTGAVNSPGSVLWRQGANLSYYVSAAGGYMQQAQKGQVSVRFANGEVRTRRGGLFGSDPTPGPGSEVSVPFEDPNAKKTDYVSLFGAIAQILASTIAIIVVVRR
ncbi:MAG TPA: SLBB domain-containing protein [Gemmatimonadales bacterium]|jgi:protein involved in polysaccharide export with SLBB domain|nr:SLBB domain-containing protein [Gemmatimonadales bacterium]